MRGRLASRHDHAHRPGLIPAGAGQTDSNALIVVVAQAHPRGCGADLAALRPASSAGGSSPRVRGRPGSPPGGCSPTGLIPAGAGQTRRCWRPRRGPRAHPRGCGADGATSPLSTICMGSSPRVRGRPLVYRGARQRHGRIPAGAGQTPRLGRVSSRTGAHPRGCGADGQLMAKIKSDFGSSPRVRGRHYRVMLRQIHPRLIPAGAGQTSSGKMTPSRLWAHPRGCGADTPDNPYRRLRVGLIPAGAGQTPRTIRTGDSGLGSSPRVRGRPVFLQWYSVVVGLIPAGAGQTNFRDMSLEYDRAHPRGCGADIDTYASVPDEVGSSPRVRGRPVDRRGADEGVGLIPAGAGQTAGTTVSTRSAWAHPRGCGADLEEGLFLLFDPGSSPRVRGRRQVGAPVQGGHGLIPAGAGQTRPCILRCPVSRAHPRGCGADTVSASIASAFCGSSPRVRGRQRVRAAGDP